MNKNGAIAIIEDAILILEPIPVEEWITNRFSNIRDAESAYEPTWVKLKCCVIGHYQRLKSDNPNDYTLLNVSDGFDYFDNSYRPSDLRLAVSKFGYDIARINNQKCSYPSSIEDKFILFDGDTPKARVMQCLFHIIKTFKEKN